WLRRDILLRRTFGAKLDPVPLEVLEHQRLVAGGQPHFGGLERRSCLAPHDLGGTSRRTDHGGQAVTADAVVDAAREIPGVLGYKCDGVGLDRLGALADGGLHVRRDLRVDALEQAAQAIRALHAGAAPAHLSISASMVRYRS